MNRALRIGMSGAIFFFWLSLYSQQPILTFKHLTKSQGLSNNKVNCIMQDKRGFVWIGTDDGLNRYDGNNVIVYKNIPGHPSSLSGNTITDLHEDAEGVLWIATADGGISSYDYRLSPEKQFRQYKHHPGVSSTIPVNIVNDLLEDEEGHLWLATSGAAVLRFDKKKERFVQPASTGPWTILDLCFDRHGMIWAGRQGGSILKIEPSTLKCETDQRYNNLYATLPHVVVTKLFRDSRNDIWFGSWDKAVYRYNSSTGQEEVFKPANDNPYSFGLDESLSFNEDRKGRIWIGGKYFGLYIYDPVDGHFYNYRHDAAMQGTLSDNTVNCIFMDRSGIAWLGTNNGVNIFHSAKQQFHQEFLPVFDKKDQRGIVIYDFYKEKGGLLWIGTSEGIYIKNGDGKYTHRKLNYAGTDLHVTRFYSSADGRFYLGTDFTLFEYDPVSGAIKPLPNTENDQVMSRLIESRIVSIAKDTIDGRPVLFAVPYGHFLAYYDFMEQRWVSRRDSVRKILSRYDISDNLIRKMVKSRDGKLWLANAKNGLTLLHKNARGNTTFINNPSEKNSISNNNIFDLKEDEKGNFWISTYGGGLNYFQVDRKEFIHYSSAYNLLEGLEIDLKGKVWCISNGGLQKFDPETGSFTYMELPDLEKTGGVKGYIYKDADGKMYVAGRGFYVAFQPEQIFVPEQQLEVFLTDLHIFNRSYSHLLSGKKITLQHNQNFFTIHFAAPNYTASTPVQYSYMLVGVDKDWTPAGTLALAPYTNLGGGEYIFKVRASTTPGTWSEKVTTIAIRIIPPFWKRAWFFVLLLVLISGITYGVYRYRINELLKRQAIRNKIAQDLHDNVGSTLSSISVYSQVAKIYKQKDRKDELQETLEKISSISSEMISEMNDIVWAINPRNDNMDTILQRMDSFARPLLASQGMQFHFKFDPQLRQLNLEMTKRKNFYLIFKEAVTNALKYSGAKNLWVDISLKQ
ncbi:MAG TPA: two-component regulator propeller domain-containing protein, partial [Chitinophagaceae bacterium]|nr:two-component regulator propeller domain-containing protein [Chitinophagaceae bacterium]